MDPATNDGSPKTAVAKKLPGPFRWPIFGSLFHLTGFKERVFMDWTEHYGDIYRVKVGSKDVVVVNGLVVFSSIKVSTTVFFLIYADLIVKIYCSDLSKKSRIVYIVLIIIYVWYNTVFVL